MIYYIHCNIKMLKSRQYPSLLCCQTHQDLTPNKWLPGQRRRRQETVFRGGISLRRSELLGDGVAGNLFLALRFCWPCHPLPGPLVKWGQCHQPSTSFRNLARNRLHFSDPSLLTSAFWTRRQNTTTQQVKQTQLIGRTALPKTLLPDFQRWLKTTLEGQPCPGYSKRHAIFKCLSQPTKVPVHLYFSPPFLLLTLPLLPKGRTFQMQSLSMVPSPANFMAG